MLGWFIVVYELSGGVGLHQALSVSVVECTECECEVKVRVESTYDTLR